MKLISTRGKAPETNFKEALFQGLALDGGLYHPLENKSAYEIFLNTPVTSSFQELALKICELWLSDEWQAYQLAQIIAKAFSFAPKLQQIQEEIYLLELFHGPSLAFKDFGACFLASCMEEILLEKKKKAVILVATSGDTGSAVARAFHQKQNIDVVILYPSGRVSFLQEKQLTTLSSNVHTLEVKGSFDDCQRLVKEAFLDQELQKKITLTSANSINIGRLFPQALYYFDAALRLKEVNSDPLVFCVPSGNFGNLTAGVYAWCWGLPVRQFIAATNINDVVPEYLKSSVFKPRPSVQTLSNAMDVGNPSNFERLLAIFNSNHKEIAKMLWGEVITDKETLATINEIFYNKNIFLDPHTAVGYLAAKRYLAKSASRKQKVIVLATAHPAKFSEIIEEATGVKPPLPPALLEVLNLPKQATLIENKLEALKEFLFSHLG